MIVDWVKFGQLVKAARKEAGLSIEALAEAVDISVHSVHFYEKARRYEPDPCPRGGSGRSISIMLRLMKWAKIRVEDFTR